MNHDEDDSLPLKRMGCKLMRRKQARHAAACRAEALPRRLPRPFISHRIVQLLFATLGTFVFEPQCLRSGPSPPLQMDRDATLWRGRSAVFVVERCVAQLPQHPPRLFFAACASRASPKCGSAFRWPKTEPFIRARAPTLGRWAIGCSGWGPRGRQTWRTCASVRPNRTEAWRPVRRGSVPMVAAWYHIQPEGEVA
jgi:hypothetical protein